MWTRRELKTKAREALKLNNGLCIAVALILAVLTFSTGTSAAKSFKDIDVHNASTVIKLAVGISSSSALVAVMILFGNSIIVGCKRFFMLNAMNEDPEDKPTINEVIYCFKEGQWVNTSLTMFVRDVYRFLWSLLFGIPGIVKGYSYKMVPYILAENPEMGINEAITKSREMMNGHKWNAFVLDLSFIGWGILSAFTLGIVGILFTNPYVFQTEAELYLAIKGDEDEVVVE